MRDVDLSRRRGRLQSRRGVDRVAHDAVLRGCAHRAGHDHPRVDADPKPQLDPELSLHARRMLGKDALHAEGAAKGALGIVLMGDRCTEDHEDRVADELLDRAIVTKGFLSKVLEDPRDQQLELLRVQIVRESREPHEVGEEDVDEPPLLLDVLHIGSIEGAIRGR